MRRGLASPQLAGIRIVDGVKILGTWPAILDVATHEAIVAELNKPERGRGRPAGSRWLLSGFTVCGRCGQPMLAGGHRKVKAIGGTDRSQRYYRCARVRNRATGCGATIGADAFEVLVEERVLVTVSRARWQQLRSGRTRQRVVDTGAVEADLAAVARLYGAGDLLEASAPPRAGTRPGGQRAGVIQWSDAEPSDLSRCAPTPALTQTTDQVSATTCGPSSPGQPHNHRATPCSTSSIPASLTGTRRTVAPHTEQTSPGLILACAFIAATATTVRHRSAPPSSSGGGSGPARSPRGQRLPRSGWCSSTTIPPRS